MAQFYAAADSASPAPPETGSEFLHPSRSFAGIARILLVLAVEIAATGPTRRASRPPAVDRGDGRRESHVGRRADCVGTAREARDSCLAANRATVPGPAAWAAAITCDCSQSGTITRRSRHGSFVCVSVGRVLFQTGGCTSATSSPHVSPAAASTECRPIRCGATNS